MPTIKLERKKNKDYAVTITDKFISRKTKKKKLGIYGFLFVRF